MAPHLIAGLALTGLVGASLGLLGAGGSIIMLPVLVYVIGVAPHAAVPLSLAIVGTTTLIAVAFHAKGREIQWGTALLVGGAALGGTYLGSRLTALVPGSVLLMAFGVLLVVVGYRMWRSTQGNEDVTTTPKRPWLMLATGSVVGVLTGFLGVGGGFLIVPALVKVGGLGMRQAVRTSLVVISMSSVAGLAAHIAHGNGPAVQIAVPLTLAALVGMAAGSATARFVSAEHLRRGFAAFVTTVGSALILVNTPTVISMKTLQEPWPWYIAGPLIGLMVPVLLVIGGKTFGVSSNLRHLCAATVPSGMAFFKYDWKREGGWNLLFALGIVIGGLVAMSVLVPEGYAVAISNATQRDLRALGIHDFSGLVPQELMGWQALTSGRGWLTLGGGGLLVGFGSRWAGGCTSGHAISGLATFQVPSLIAVCGFFAGGLLMTHVVLPLVF